MVSDLNPGPFIMIGGTGLHALRTSLFYLTVIGFGAAVVTSTQVVEVTGPSGFRDRALGLVSDVRSRLFPATESAPALDDGPGAQDVPLAAALSACLDATAASSWAWLISPSLRPLTSPRTFKNAISSLATSGAHWLTKPCLPDPGHDPIARFF